MSFHPPRPCIPGSGAGSAESEKSSVSAFRALLQKLFAHSSPVWQRRYTLLANMLTLLNEERQRAKQAALLRTKEGARAGAS